MRPLALDLGLAAGAGLVLVADLFTAPQQKRLLGQLSVAILVLLFVASFFLDTTGAAFSGAYVGGPWVLFFKRAALAAGALALLGGLEHVAERWPHRQGEYALMVLSSVLGMTLLPGARDLIFLIVAFELMGVPLYVLATFGKDDSGRHSAEAGLKLYVVGAASTAITLFGLSLVVGLAGTTRLAGIATLPLSPLLGVGMMLLVAGMGFKLGVAPFHMWVPDTYQGASTPFVSFLSVAPKASGLAALVVVFSVGLSAHRATWLPVLVTLSALTLLVGNLLAIPQPNVKRLLAFSGVAQMGYLLMGLAAGTTEGIGMTLFYAATYIPTNLGVFLVVHAVTRADSVDPKDEGDAERTVSTFDGLARRSPWLAMAFLLFLLSLAGIPFVAGFWAQLYVFMAAWKVGLGWLVVLGAVLATVALYYYLGLARAAYVNPPKRSSGLAVDPALAFAIVVCLLAVVLIGVWPRPLLDAAMRAAAAAF